MEFSSIFRAANGSLPSPNGSLIASIVPPRLVIRSSSTLQVQRVVSLNPTFASKVQFMRWSPPPQSNLSPPACGLVCKRRSGIDNSEEEGTVAQRLILADDETIQVYDVRDDKWTATITQGFGGIQNVEFGRNQDEIIVFSEFNLKVTVWNLITERRIEIPNPKFATKGFGYRPCTSHFAILTRSSTHDVVSIHQNTNYRVSASFTLPTLDAQGLKWSPCGRWLAVWDSAASGYKVLVYTADGHLYRTHEKPCEGLGVKTVEWSPAGDFLTVGSYDGKLCFLSNYTFSPVISMNHTRTVRLPSVTVWSERPASGRDRYYSQLQQPTALPVVAFNPADPQPKIGISTMAFSNPDGTLIATKNDCMPSTVWIWSLKLLRPYAILVHLNPVKSINWHPSIPDLLMIQCTPDPNSDTADPSSTVYLWSSTWKAPRAIHVPMDRVTGSSWAKWIHTAAPNSNSSSTVSTSPQPFASNPDRRSHSPEKEGDKRPMLLFGDRDGFIVGYIEDEPVEDVEEMDVRQKDGNIQENQPWSPVDWCHYAPTQDISRPSPGRSGSYKNDAPTPLLQLSEKSRSINRSSSSSVDKRDDDTFEYRLRKPGISVRS